MFVFLCSQRLDTSEMLYKQNEKIMRNLINALSIIIIVFVICTTAYSQTQQWIQFAQGTFTLSIYIQDSILWIGTKDGLKKMNWASGAKRVGVLQNRYCLFLWVVY